MAGYNTQGKNAYSIPAQILARPAFAYSEVWVTFVLMTFFQGKILCVDDDSDDLSFLSDAIRDINPNFEVVEKKNGLEAISYLNEAKINNQLPCLILLDVNMPFLDGKQTLEKIRVDPELSSLPVIIFTSSQNPNDKALFKSKGVEMYTKPMTVQELHDMVKKFLTHCF